MEKVVLLADRKSPSWDFTETIQNFLKERYKSEVPIQKVSIRKFRNKEVNMHVPENVRKKDIYFIHDSDKNPQQWWVELLLLKDLLLSASAESLTLVLPDMLYSRQDRKEKPHVPISARALAKSISGGLKRIITMDLHASQLQGFYPENIPIDNLYSFPTVTKHLEEEHKKDLENLVIVSPDAGGVGRARSFLQRLEKMKGDSKTNYNYSLAVITKIRPKAGEIERMDLAGDVKGKNCLIVDDIIDSGETLCKASSLLKGQGAKKIFCYGTHRFFTKGTKKLCKYFQEVMTSNTHYRKKDGVEVLDVSSVFGEAIFRAQKGVSISELFE